MSTFKPVPKSIKNAAKVYKIASERPCGAKMVETKFLSQLLKLHLLQIIVKVVSLVSVNEKPAAGAEIFGVFERRRIFFPYFKNEKKTLVLEGLVATNKMVFRGLPH